MLWVWRLAPQHRRPEFGATTFHYVQIDRFDSWPYESKRLGMRESRANHLGYGNVMFTLSRQRTRDRAAADTGAPPRGNGSPETARARNPEIPLVRVRVLSPLGRRHIMGDSHALLGLTDRHHGPNRGASLLRVFSVWDRPLMDSLSFPMAS